MKILEEVQAIIAKYDLKPIVLPDGHKDIYNFIREFPEMEKNYHCDKDDNYFINKYHSYIPQGWYGFAIGEPIVPAWMEVLDEILKLCIKSDPNFQIYQIKTKWGGMRFYTGTSVIEDINDVESVIEDIYMIKH